MPSLRVGGGSQRLFMAFALAVLYMVFSVAAFSGSGTGTGIDPYQISSCVQLQEITDTSPFNYTLVADIDCADTINWNGGEGFIPANLTGYLNGSGHIVRNLYINQVVGYQFGLLRQNDGVVENLGIEDANITCGVYCGILAGYNNGLVSNCYTTGSIIGSFSAYAGGIIGVNTGVLSDSWTRADIIAYQIKGGILGYNTGTISDCYSLSYLHGDGGYGDRGGLCATHVGGTAAGSLYWNSDYFNSVYFAICSSGAINENAKNTSEMKKKSTFVGWDFTGTWDICTRADPNSYPVLRSFGGCCVGSWVCTKYTACGQNNQDCLAVADTKCGYTFDPVLDGNLTQFSRNCSINAQTPDVDLMNFDLRYSTNVMILGLFIFLWLALVIIAFAFRSQNFGLMSFIVAIIVGLLLIQVHVVLTLLFILMNVIFVLRFGKRFR